MSRRLMVVPACVLALVLLLPATASAWEVKSKNYPGMQKMKLKYGPVDIFPGQNTIEAKGNQIKPKVPGYITRFKPNLQYMNGKIPPVDVIHLHHGVWLINSYPVFAAGEEKTIFQLPKGYGYRHEPDDRWIMNYMIHNLTPTPTKVWITYDIDYVPDTAPAAATMKTVKTRWLDVKGLSIYPVFDALKGQGGKDGKYTYPDEAPAKDPAGGGQSWTVNEDGALITTAAHLHPGGLYGDLRITRNGQTKRLFRSTAKYWEPAGAVSWDVAQGATSDKWRVAVKKGDVLSVHGTYDTKKASWYESMMIMPVAFSPGDTTGKDPFTQRIDQTEKLTHGHLAENDNHGGQPFGLPDPREMLTGPTPSGPVSIKGFLYGRGDLNAPGKSGRPPAVKRGNSLTFRNFDSVAGSDQPIWHTVTSCKQPCNRSTGVAYPLADGNVRFDSGQIGLKEGGIFAPTTGKLTWKTPKNLSTGTYTYFCRVHPFMRGSFRVVK